MRLQTEFSIPHLQYKGNVCVCGLTASGKSVHSHLLAGEFGLTYVSGSQILLNIAGVSPIQPKDFWVTPEARRLKSADGYGHIDTELLKIEARGIGYVFDTITQPWRRRRPALNIWLESSLESRILKSMVSHRGRGHLTPDQYAGLLTDKDTDTIRLCRDLYGFEVGADLSPFDLVLDVSSLIREATLDASLESIRVVHSLVRPAAAWYLTGRNDCEDQFTSAVDTNRDVVKLNRVGAAKRERG